MSSESLEQFKREVLQDQSLARVLREESDRGRFVGLIVRLGAERGYNFTPEEVEGQMRAARRAWLERLL